MNTQGWIRALMAKNMGEGDFVEHVGESLGREFEMEASTIKQKGAFMVKLGIYTTIIPVNVVATLKTRGPYCLDRFVLDQYRVQGFQFDMYRSQYIRYCYGFFHSTVTGSAY